MNRDAGPAASATSMSIAAPGLDDPRLRLLRELLLMNPEKSFSVRGMARRCSPYHCLRLFWLRGPDHFLLSLSLGAGAPGRVGRGRQNHGPFESD